MRTTARRSDLRSVVVALDAMGGDAGPSVAVEAAAQLSLDRSDIKLLLVGDQEQLSSLLDSQPYVPERLSIKHAASWVGQGESPAQALKEKPQASILVAAGLVAEGKADALVSAGNTGACILAGSKVLGRISGVRRAALAAVYPTELRRGPKDDPFSLILDVGCTLQASSHDLATFAAMGAAYARSISGTNEPTVALLSNGSEPGKGLPEIVEAHGLLQGLPGMSFMGNVEGLDIPRGRADVVVTNGFMGNVVLKMLEGMYERLGEIATEVSQHRMSWKVGMALMGSSLRSFKYLIDWEEYGGAPILGLKSVFIKAHGRSSARAISNACRVAAKAARSNLTEEIRRGIATLPEEAP